MQPDFPAHFRPQVKCRSRKHLDWLQAHTELNLRQESWFGSAYNGVRVTRAQTEEESRHGTSLLPLFGGSEITLLQHRWIHFSEKLSFSFRNQSSVLRHRPLRTAIWRVCATAYAFQYKKKQGKLLESRAKQEKCG